MVDSAAKLLISAVENSNLIEVVLFCRSHDPIVDEPSSKLDLNRATVIRKSIEAGLIDQYLADILLDHS